MYRNIRCSIVTSVFRPPIPWHPRFFLLDTLKESFESHIEIISIPQFCFWGYRIFSIFYIEGVFPSTPLPPPRVLFLLQHTERELRCTRFQISKPYRLIFVIVYRYHIDPDYRSIAKTTPVICCTIGDPTYCLPPAPVWGKSVNAGSRFFSWSRWG